MGLRVVVPSSSSSSQSSYYNYNSALHKNSQQRMVHRKSARRRASINSTTTSSRLLLGTVLSATLLVVLLAALVYVYTASLSLTTTTFPITSSLELSSSLSSTHAHDDDKKRNKRQFKKQQILQKLRSSQDHAYTMAMTDAAADVHLLPQPESQHPARIVTCRCYPQVQYAFASRQFTTTTAADDYTDAWIIWKTGTDIDTAQLQPWQRPNHFPGERTMDRKGAMFAVLRQYAQRHDVSLDFLPETYLLYNQDDKDRFLQRLSEANHGMNMPWVLKRTKASRGRGVTMLGPQSAALQALRDELSNNNNNDASQSLKPGHIVQSYIPREWTFQGHKCDLRVYVLVASVQPLVVYYHDGIVRTAVGLHDEENFDNSKAHLTNVSQNKANRTAWEPVKTFGQLQHELELYLTEQPHEVARNLLLLGDNEVAPIDHVRHQIKHILGIVFRAFKSRINLKDWPVDNAFAVMGADFVIDKDLKVWLLEMQLGPQLVGDNHKEKIDILQDVLTTTIDVVEEVFYKQTRHEEPLLPLRKAGNFELVYADEDASHPLAFMGE